MRATPPRPMRRARAPAAAGALFLLMLGALAGFSVAKSEERKVGSADSDEAPTSSSSSSRASSSKKDAVEDPGAVELVHSVVDDATGLRTDTFLKPLGTVTPGQVFNTRCVQL
jgi:hypothetical protein